MQMTRGWTGFRTAVIALGLLAWSTPHTRADGIFSYHTSGGTVGAPSSGSPAISFVPVQSATVDANSNISLGSFVVAGLPTGQSTTYNNTPFDLSLIPDSYNGTTSSNQNAIDITGTMTGTVTGPNQSSVILTFNSTSLPLSVGSGAGPLILANPKELLVPSSDNGGVTTLQATIAIQPTPVGPEAGVPEPSTIALFLSTVGGLYLRRLVQNRRQRIAA